MIIGSVSENKDTEKRISVTPDNVKKFVTNGFKVYLEKDGMQFDEVVIANNKKEAIEVALKNNPESKAVYYINTKWICTKRIIHKIFRKR